MNIKKFTTALMAASVMTTTVAAPVASNVVFAATPKTIAPITGSAANQAYPNTKVTTETNAIPRNTSGNKVSVKLNTKKGKKTFTCYRQQGFGNDKAGKWLSGHGCGVCAFITTVQPFSKTFGKMTPKQFYNNIMNGKDSKWLGSYTKSGGSLGPYGMQELLKRYDKIDSQVVPTFTYDSAAKDIKQHLLSGQPVIVCVRNKNFKTGKIDKKYTNYAHYIALLGMTPDGKVIVADSSNHKWSLVNANTQWRFKLGNLNDIVYHMESVKDPVKTMYWSNKGGKAYIKIFIN